MNNYTENLSDFGAREREIAGKLLLADLPDNFDNTGVKLAFNRNSGEVFLVNEDCQVAMLINDNQLEIFYSTPYEGIEGFLSDIIAENDPDKLNSEDVQYIIDCADNDGVELNEKWQSAKIDLITDNDA